MRRWLLVVSLLLLAWAPDAWACQKYSSVVQSITGPIVPNAVVTVKTANTANLATIYSDPNCAATTTNPIISATDGTFTFYANDGHYDFSPITASGFSINPILDVAIFEPFGMGSKSGAEFTSPFDLCATGTGAIDSTGSMVRTLHINQPMFCTISKAVPVTLSLLCEGFGSVTVSAAITLTINGPVKNITDHLCFIGVGTTTFGATSRGDAFNVDGTSPLTYSASMTGDRRLGKTQIVVATNNTAFTMQAPLPATVPIGTELCYDLKNSSGGALGAATWNALFKLYTWVNPANNTERTICFRWDGTNYRETWRNASDVPL